MTSENIGEHEDLGLSEDDADKIMGGAKAKVVATDKLVSTPDVTLQSINPQFSEKTKDSLSG